MDGAQYSSCSSVPFSVPVHPVVQVLGMFITVLFLFLCTPHLSPSQVLDALGETVPCVQYKSWIGYFPGGDRFTFTADSQAYRDEIQRVGGQVWVYPRYALGV